MYVFFGLSFFFVVGQRNRNRLFCQAILWMDEILHYPRNPRMTIPLYIPSNHGVNHGFKVVRAGCKGCGLRWAQDMRVLPHRTWTSKISRDDALLYACLASNPAPLGSRGNETGSEAEVRRSLLLPQHFLEALETMELQRNMRGSCFFLVAGCPMFLFHEFSAQDRPWAGLGQLSGGFQDVPVGDATWAFVFATSRGTRTFLGTWVRAGRCLLADLLP